MMEITPITKEQAIILSGWTGVLCCDMNDLLLDMSQRSGWEILNEDLKDLKIAAAVQQLYKEDFFKLIGYPVDDMPMIPKENTC